MMCEFYSIEHERTPFFLYINKPCCCQILLFASVLTANGDRGKSSARRSLKISWGLEKLLGGSDPPPPPPGHKPNPRLTARRELLGLSEIDGDGGGGDLTKFNHISSLLAVYKHIASFSCTSRSSIVLQGRVTLRALPAGSSVSSFLLCYPHCSSIWLMAYVWL